MERPITPPPCFSFSRSASSSAKLSGSFISKPMSDSLIQFPAMASGASFAGTCLMHTMMFTRRLPFGIPHFLGREKNAGTRGGNEIRPLFARPAAENERGVGAAKSKGIRKGVFHRRLARVFRHVIQIAFGIGIFKINGGREDPIAQRKHADAGFEAASAAQQMAGHGFRRADGNALGALAKNALEGARFDHVANGRGSAVGVHVANIVVR